ncbi:beta family protein [Stenotrophomonas maltophilia]|uniref:beta family protein n=1 Tax=Stenotrophomonas maltophilia TaxID=40324 RepID=UPI0021C66104|nr:beta family protein [Stenotrophomonas maltophilia]MCU1090003.1 beta family protein [Stenotrophomonas maltophilia]
MRVTYTPFYHAKDGEFCALSKAEPGHKEGLLPLFEIGRFTDKMGELKRYRDETAPKVSYLNWVADSVQTVFPARMVMVDTFAWKIKERLETGEVPIAYAINALLEREQPVIPVVGVDRWDDPDYQFALKSLSSEDLPIWALRLQSDEIEDAIDEDHFLESIDEILQGLGLSSSNVGLLFDFGDVSKKDSDLIVEQSERIFALVADYNFKFFSVVGCSMPASVTQAAKLPNTQAVLPRKEMIAWRSLRAAHLDLPIAYGDYGVRGPSSTDAPNPHINGKIRYSIQDAFFVARGQSKVYENGEQMYRLANIVASSPHFLGPHFSWGDKEIHRRAVREKKVGPGNANSWVKIDSSHHLAWVAAEVAAVEHALSATPVLV